MTNPLPSPAQPLKIGTRGSPLALWQAHEVRRCLMAAFDLPEAAFAIVVIKVTGDQILDKALKEIGGKGLFTREIEEALLAGGIDIAVITNDLVTAEDAERAAERRAQHDMLRRRLGDQAGAHVAGDRQRPCRARRVLALQVRRPSNTAISRGQGQ